MNRTRVSLLALVALAVLVTTLGGCALKKGIVKVNGEKIKKEEFYLRLQQVPVQTAQGPMPAGEYVMRQMIEEKLVQQLAKKEGVEPSEAQIQKKLDYIKKQNGGDISRLGRSLDDIKKQVTQQQALVNIITKGVSVPESDVKAAYDIALNVENSGLKRPEQIFISAIITKSKSSIDKAYGMLKEGRDFGSVAGVMSEASNTKQSKGKLNWISKDQQDVPKIIRETAFNLEVGTYSKPFSVDDGWAILRVDQKRPAKVTQYNEVKDVLKEQMMIRKGFEKNSFQKDMQKFAKDAEIKINAERYKKIADEIKKNAATSLTANAEKK